MTILFYNNAATTLAAPLSAAGTSAQLASGAGSLFVPGPGPGDYFCLTFSDAATGLQNEIVHATAVSGDTVTIVRAQEGTIAQNWSIGDSAENRVTAGTMQAVQDSPAPSALKWTTSRTMTVNGDGSGAVTFDGSANFSITLTNSQASKWTTARTLSFTGDTTGSGSVDGSGNVSFAMTGVRAAKLTTARTISMTGDLSWSVSFDGSGNVTSTGTLSNTGVAAGSYTLTNVTFDSKGRATSASSPDALAIRLAAKITTYFSPSFALSSAQSGSYMHGLVSVANFVHAELILTCTSSDAGYAVGDKIALPVASTGSGTGRGFTVWYNSTYAGWSRDGNGILAQSKSGGLSDLNMNNWNGQIQLLVINN